MEVHAHTHTARKKWTHYLWEFLMLFLAVFCGFLAENQREHYIEKLRAKQFAESLVKDLEKDTAMAGNVISQIHSLVEAIDSLKTFVGDKRIDQINNFDLVIRIPLSCYRPYSWSRATLDQIKNSGGLRYFTNHSIVEKISSYDALTRHLDEDAKGDEERNAKVIEYLGTVADLSYPHKLLQSLYNVDILRIQDYLKVNPSFTGENKENKKLLTNEINDIKKLVNLSLIQRPNLITRGNNELPGLVMDARALIQILKNEFHLN